MKIYKIRLFDFNVSITIKADSLGIDGDFFVFYDETNKPRADIVATFNRKIVGSIIESEDK